MNVRQPASAIRPHPEIVNVTISQWNSEEINVLESALKMICASTKFLAEQVIKEIMKDMGHREAEIKEEERGREREREREKKKQ